MKVNPSRALTSCRMRSDRSRHYYYTLRNVLAHVGRSCNDEVYPRFHWSIVPQYGTMTQLGHVDFFPGSSLLSDWGWNQPGCWQFEDVGS